MLRLLVPVLLAAAVSPAAVPDDDGYTKDWVALPNANAVDRCIKNFVSEAAPTKFLLSCRSAPDDRLTDCKVLGSLPKRDARYEKAALCATSLFRVRVTDRSGAKVSGIEVKVPFVIAGTQ